MEKKYCYDESELNSYTNIALICGIVLGVLGTLTGIALYLYSRGLIW